MGFTVHKSDRQWREELSDAEFRVLRRASTEAPWSGEYVHTNTHGIYRCRACGSKLFRSDTKFEAHCGWPSFYQPTPADNVILREDTSLGMQRTEVLCANCGSHLGHLFEDAPQTPTDERYCINSISLSLEEDEAA